MSKVLAVFNGREITDGDLDNTIAQFPAERQQFFKTEEGRKNLLNEIISFELIHDYAKDNKFDLDDLYLEKIEAIKKETLIQWTISKVLSEAEVKEEDIKEFYNNNKNMFIEEERVSTKHILVETKEEAEKIIDEIKNGLSFEEAAKEYSNCPSKGSGGDLGTFGRGRMVKEFEEAAFEMKEGTISNPVKTQFGYHIIKLEKKYGKGTKEYNEVKDLIKKQLHQEKERDLYKKFTEDLKNKYSVELK
ncbi:peptidylprolyl isomerase [Clostridium tetani]|uniref:peptidylprolyl isomerase n=1 Tax=Clostridium tetani TaxID=1513 RepID=UPI00100BDB55|nr:peptidylprolyl isomerase [Clostridium tetani]RXI41137.1 peptidylprolyl isomerase [Clostridium tetani]